MDATLVLGKQGRVVIPAEIRAALGLSPGDRLHLQVSGSTLIVESQRESLLQLQALTSHVSADRSLVEELLADRQLAAANE